MRAWRSRLRISQEELAGRAGLHRTYVCDIERGARNVSLKSIEKLARALDVSVARLFANGEQIPEVQQGLSRLSAHGDLVDILFVEDEVDDIEMALQALKNVKISNRIHVARDGEEALDFLFRTGSYADRPDGTGPHMILLDLNLPKVSGLEVLRRIKSDARTQAIPVVVLTASKFDRDVTASKRLGADGYIVKPVDFHTLAEVTPQLSLHWALLKPAQEVNA